MTTAREPTAYQQTRIAYVSMCCGFASLVPLVILVTFLPAVLFGLFGTVRALRLPGRPGLQAAILGIGMALLGLTIQAAVVGFAALVGLAA